MSYSYGSLTGSSANSRDSGNESNVGAVPVTSHKEKLGEVLPFYEQLGAPTVLYRNEAYYASSIKPTKTIDKNKKSKEREPPTIAVDNGLNVQSSLYPPQPWGCPDPPTRNIGPHSEPIKSHYKLDYIEKDAKRFLDQTQRDFRTRSRMYSKGKGGGVEGDLLGYQKWDQDWWDRYYRQREESYAAALHDKNDNETANQANIPNDNNLPTTKQRVSRSKTRRKSKQPSLSTLFYQQNKQKYDASPYVSIDTEKTTRKLYKKVKSLNKPHHRREEMYTSPVEGYTAPFCYQAITYAMGDNRPWERGKQQKDVWREKEMDNRKKRAKMWEKKGAHKKARQSKQDKSVNESNEREVSKEDDTDGNNSVDSSDSDSNNSNTSGSSLSSAEESQIERHNTNKIKSPKHKNDETEFGFAESESEELSEKLPNDNGNSKDDLMSPPKIFGYSKKPPKSKEVKSQVQRSQLSLTNKWPLPLNIGEQASDNPLYFGNCLQLIPCVCRACFRSNDRSLSRTDESRGENDDSSLSGSGSESVTSHSSGDQSSSTGSESDGDQGSIIYSIERDNRNSINSKNELTERSQKNTSNNNQGQNDISENDKIQQGEDLNVKIPNRNVEQRWFLLHPQGNCISLSPLFLPRDSEESKSSQRKKKRPMIKPIDVGGKILEIRGCFDVRQYFTNDHPLHMYQSKDWSWYAVVRTPAHCSLVACVREKLLVPKKIQDLECHGSYTLKEVARVDLSNKDDGSYTPINLTTIPSMVIPHIQDATFATVSRTSSNSPFHEEGTNVIHHTVAKGSSLTSPTMKTQKYVISNIKSISQIEFSNMHPMVLWSAARTSFDSFFHQDEKRYRRPRMGYGHNLYSIDLRSDKASCIWSPSHAEFWKDRTHSISGILCDSHQPHTVFVSSISAGGKMWQIDCRMPAQAVYSWSLAGLCNDWDAKAKSSSIYGCGTLMTRPIDFNTNSSHAQEYQHSSNLKIPIICASKDPGSYGFQLNQQPIHMPRFQTCNLERPSTGGIDSFSGDNFGGAGVATSGSFRYPECSSGTFTCGLAAFYTKLSSILEDECDLGYNKAPSNALCIISATSHGDLYTHTLLQCKGNQERRAAMFEGLPLGSCAVPVSKLKTYGNTSDGTLQMSVSNNYPVPSQSMLKHNVARRSQCRSFETVKLNHLPKMKKEEHSENAVEIYHPDPIVRFGQEQESQATSNLKLSLSYVTESNSAIMEQANEYFKSDSSDTPFDNHYHGYPSTDMNETKIRKLKELWDAG